MGLLTLDSLSKTYVTPRGTVEAIADVSMDVVAGEFIVVVGPSGCGKSTMLRIIAGLEPSSGGTVKYNDQLITAPLPDIGVVFQAYDCFPWLTVRGNVRMGLLALGLPRSEMDKREEDMLRLVRLEPFAAALPRELSGGMRQRVALARTLAPRPRVLLMDEPFGALDAQTRADMQSELKRIWRESNATALFVTHDVGEALVLGTRLVVLSARPASVLLDTPLSVLDEYERERVAIRTLGLLSKERGNGE